MQVQQPLHIAAFLCLIAPLQAQQTDLRLEPYLATLPDGSELAGELGHLVVPQRHGVKGGPTFTLAFVRFASTNPEPGPPIYYLAGGPGASGVELAAEIALDPAYDLLAHGDLIALDQRGTGLSKPLLEAGGAFEIELPLDQPLTRAALIAAQAESFNQALAYWRAQGVDPAALTTEESADDLEALRLALGHQRIVPFGISYGSHLGLSYLRRHGANVERAVLIKVEGPDSTFKLPSETQAFLEQAALLAKTAPELDGALPDLVGSVKTLLASLAKEPRTLTTNKYGDPVSVVIGPYDLQLTVAYALSGANTLATLPMAISLMEQGQFDHLIGFALQNRVVATDSLMALQMDCASAASPKRLKQIAKEAQDPNNLLADAMLWPVYPEVCTAAAVEPLPAAFRAPLRSDRPVLFVSGTLDARTPPSNVEALLAQLPKASHLQITNTGHDSRENQSETFTTHLQTFLSGQPIPSQTIPLPPVEFRWRPTR